MGGVATLSYEVLRAMRGLGAEVRVIAPAGAGAREFDATSPLQTVRSRASRMQPERAAPGLALSLAAEALRFKPDAVLNMLWLPGGVESLLCRPVFAARGIRYFVFAHGVEVLESRRTLRKHVRSALAPLKHAVFSGASAVFTNSRFSRDLVAAECGISPKKIEPVFAGVDPVEFAPGPVPHELLAAYGLEGRRVFLTVARLEDYKGIDRAIAALRFVAQREPRVAYLICGEGKDRARLEAIARHYGVHDRVVFAGGVPLGRLRDYYNACEAFVLLTRSDWDAPNVEGFGLVFLEAAACAKPSIAGRSGGIPDAVQSGRTGWLVDPTDDRAIAAAMLEALARPQEARARGEAARARAVASFGWDRMAGRMLERMRAELGEVGCVRN
jgi:phosphatidylinositol alpha-1,6-mannosyltransferase